jgi:DNA polymerase III epsilon subunit-like protein
MINLVLDTETSGLGPKDGPCEIAMLVVDDNLNVIKEYVSLIDPEVPITVGAYNIHGINDRMVYDAPTLPEYFRVVLSNVFDAEPIRLIAHNAPFDLKFVKPYLKVVEVVNTLH